MFEVLRENVKKRFDLLSGHQLFSVHVGKNLFDAYLGVLPENEVQLHYCDACRSFLTRYGNVVAIIDDKIATLWDFEIDGEYADVPKALHEIVRKARIVEPFYSDTKKLGVDSNLQQLADGTAFRWTHFAAILPSNLVWRPNSKIKTLDSALSIDRGTKDVFKRGLKELSLSCCLLVKGLIDRKALYRGEEFLERLLDFIELKTEFDALGSETKRHIFYWKHFRRPGARIRNSAFGSLLVDLSNGQDLETAVTAYEHVVAPANYRRPTALVSQESIDYTEKFLKENAYESAMQRRHARPEDVDLADLLYVNRGTGDVDGVFESLKTEAKVDLSKTRRRPLTLDQFLGLLPTVNSLYMLVEPEHPFVSLIAPVDTDSKPLFSWSNNFSWTYQNNLTDALKEKVKAAGGRTDAELRISLEWFNFDDLDLHVFEPNGNEIAFHSPRSPRTSGFLDVDMNAMRAVSRTPVENVAFGQGELLSGAYKVVIHNYQKRENVDFGFNLQIECRDTKVDLSYTKAVPHNGSIVAAGFCYSAREGFSDLSTKLDTKSADRSMYGLMTGRWQRVNSMMWSPNYWRENRTGNRHLFFILDKARVEKPLRPFFNEFLHPSLYEHRRVMELLGEKMKVQPSDQQLSGVGFSLTQHRTFVVKMDNVVYEVATHDQLVD